MPHTSDITPNIIALYRHGDGLSVICIEVKRHIGSYNYPYSCLGFYPTKNLLPDLLHTKQSFLRCYRRGIHYYARDTRYDKNVACDKLDENRMKIVPSDFCRMESDGVGWS